MSLFTPGFPGCIFFSAGRGRLVFLLYSLVVACVLGAGVFLSVPSFPSEDVEESQGLVTRVVRKVGGYGQCDHTFQDFLIIERQVLTPEVMNQVVRRMQAASRNCAIELWAPLVGTS